MPTILPFCMLGVQFGAFGADGFGCATTTGEVLGGADITFGTDGITTALGVS